MRPRPLRTDPAKTAEFVERSRQRARDRAADKAPVRTLERKPGPGRSRGVSPASNVQREKIRLAVLCVGCGRERSEYRVLDPAHLVSRGLGGCDHEDCVVPLCRTMEGGCHRAFDAGQLDLLPKLEPLFRAEQAHAVLHLGLSRAYKRLGGNGGQA